MSGIHDILQSGDNEWNGGMFSGAGIDAAPDRVIGLEDWITTCNASRTILDPTQSVEFVVPQMGDVGYDREYPIVEI